MLPRAGKPLLLYQMILCAFILCSCTPLPFYFEAKECKDWVREANKKELKSEEIVAKFPNVEERYNYYICINKNRDPQTVYADIFLSDVERSLPTLERRLRNTNDSTEIVYTLMIFHKIQAKGAYKVSGDKSLTGAILEARERANGSGWEPLIDKILHQMYPKEILQRVP